MGDCKEGRRLARGQRLITQTRKGCTGGPKTGSDLYIVRTLMQKGMEYWPCHLGPRVKVQALHRLLHFYVANILPGGNVVLNCADFEYIVHHFLLEICQWVNEIINESQSQLLGVTSGWNLTSSVSVCRLWTTFILMLLLNECFHESFSRHKHQATKYSFTWSVSRS